MKIRSYTSAFALGRVTEQNVAHVLKLELTWQVEHVEWQVLLKRAEEERAEIQLQVRVALRLVILVWAQPQPKLIVLYDAVRISVPVPVSVSVSRDWRLGPFSSVHRSILRHGYERESQEFRVLRLRHEEERGRSRRSVKPRLPLVDRYAIGLERNSGGTH